MAETRSSEVAKRSEAEGRAKGASESAPALAVELKPPHTPDDGHDHAKEVESAKRKAMRLAAVPFVAGGFAAAKAVEHGAKIADKPLEKLEKWGDKLARKIGDVPLVGGLLLWALEKVGLVGKGGGGGDHGKKDDHGHGKKDDHGHGKKGGGGHGGGHH